MSKSDAHVPGLAKGLCSALGVPSGGAGTSQLPLVETSRARSRKAARQTGSRHEFDIIDPFHSSKIFWWQLWHCPGWFCVCQNSSYGGGKACASAVMYGAASGIRLGRSRWATSGCLTHKLTPTAVTTNVATLSTVMDRE